MGVVRFDEIAKESRGTFRGSLGGVPIVGLEHIEPYDMLLNKWDVDVETTFTKAFHKGQIMFGRRRAYQHKACVATCDGICSGDITLIEPVEGKVYPDLLPFIVQNDDFFEHAIKGSNGALSPRVKWEHMASFEVNLPSLAEQKVLAEKLWAAYEVKQSYLKMIAATEEMVKSQFIEMFGDPTKNTKSLPSKKGEELFVFSSGKANTKSNLSKDFPYDCYGGNGTTGRSNQWLIDYPTIVIGRVGEYCGCVHKTTGKVWITDNAIYIKEYKERTFCEDFLFYLMIFLDFHRLADETGQPKITQRPLLMTDYIIPPMHLQEQFVAIAHQSDKSISELRKSVDAIDKVIKSLINENL